MSCCLTVSGCDMHRLSFCGRILSVVLRLDSDLFIVLARGIVLAKDVKNCNFPVPCTKLYQRTLFHEEFRKP